MWWYGIKSNSKEFFSSSFLKYTIVSNTNSIMAENGYGFQLKVTKIIDSIESIKGS